MTTPFDSPTTPKPTSDCGLACKRPTLGTDSIFETNLKSA